MITANPLLGTVLHAVGATSAAVCYTPQKRVKGWSWQTYWLTQAVFCWLLLPLLGAWLALGVSLATLISSVLFLTYGNYLGGQAAGH